MTFASRTFQGMSQGSPIGFSAGISNNSVSTGVRSGSLQLLSDGTGTHTVAGVSGVGLSWYAPAGTGVGAGVWVKLTVNSTTGTNITGSSTGAVISLASTAGWTFTSTGPTTEGFGSFTLTFYGDAGGTNLLLTQTGSWDVGYTP